MKLTKYLKRIQTLQAKSLDRTDMKMFEVDVRHYDDGETSLWVTLKLISEEEYHYFTLYTFNSEEENDAALAQITDWLGQTWAKQKKVRGTARTLQPDTMQTTTI